MTISPTATTESDYVSPNLETINIDDCFPNMIVADKTANDWPYLSKHITHKWRVHRRHPAVGFVSRDEAALLYNNARVAAGRPCLEIGCWHGFSAAHIALGSGNLEIIDPVLSDPEVIADVQYSLNRAGLANKIIFHAAESPLAVHRISKRQKKRWAFTFIDGNHDGFAPALDADAVCEFAASDAMVLFHDLASPDVTAGLEYFQEEGWNVMVYMTMQIMGVAWRGTMQPVAHIPDPQQAWIIPDHLRNYCISGMSEDLRQPSASKTIVRSDGADIASVSSQSKFEKRAGLMRFKNVILLEEMSRLDEFARWATRLNVLARIMRYRLTKSKMAAEALVQRRMSKLALCSHNDAVVGWLTKKGVIGGLFFQTMSFQRRSAKRKVIEVLHRGPLGQSPHQLWIEIEALNAKIEVLKAVEEVNVVQEKLIADLKIEIALLSHSLRSR